MNAEAKVDVEMDEAAGSFLVGAEADLPAALASEEKMRALVARVEAQARAQMPEPDTSGEAGRQAIRSTARKVTRSKTAIDKAALALTEEMRARTAAVKIPTFACKPGCHDCCGIVPFSDRERGAAAARAPLIAWTRLGDSWVPTGALASGDCPFLGIDGCTIYDIRPPVCQLFGAVDDPLMTCPHGCGPKRRLSAAEAGVALRGGASA